MLPFKVLSCIGYVVLSTMMCNAASSAVFVNSLNFNLTVTGITVDGNPNGILPSGAILGADIFGPDFATFAVGNASASITQTTTLAPDLLHIGIGNVVSLSVQMNGIANPPFGIAQAYYSLGGAVSLINLSQSDIEVHFSYSYAFSGIATVSSPSETAFSYTVVAIAQDQDEGTSDGDFYTGPYNESGSDTMSISANGPDIDSLPFLVQTVGHASVPESASIAIWGIGALGAGLVAGRKKTLA